MAMQILQLGIGSSPVNTKMDPLGTAVAAGKARIVKSMRFVNTSTTTAVTLQIFVVAGPETRLISPANLILAPGALYIDDHEITLEAAQKIIALPGATGGPIDFVVSGVEKDV